MVTQVFSNAIVLMGRELEATHGYLVIRDGFIEKISKGVPPKRGSAIDLKGGFVLPPFTNSHTHLADSVAKELYLGKTQAEVVGSSGVKFAALESKPDEEVIEAVRLTSLDMLRTGTLAHCDFREGGLKGVKLLRRASQSIKSIVLGRPLKFAELDEVLENSEGIGLPSLDVFKKTTLKEISKRTKRAGKLLAIHVAETEEAQEFSRKKFKKGEVERAIELDSSFVVHAVWTSKRDFESLAQTDIPVVFCPRANSLLGSGVPPIQFALDTGAKFCFGTDNATVVQPDLFEELRFAWACLRRSSREAGSSEAQRLLSAATIEPLTIFNLPWGPIQEGNPATFMVLARGNNLANLTDVYAGLVNRARADNLRAIYQNGKTILS